MSRIEACFEKSFGRVVNTPFRGVMFGTVLGAIVTVGAIKCWRRMGRQVTRITLIGGSGALGAYLLYKGSKEYRFPKNNVRFQEKEEKREDLLNQPALVGEKLQLLTQAMEQRWPDRYEYGQFAVVVHVEVKRKDSETTVASQGCILRGMGIAEGIEKLAPKVQITGKGIPKIFVLASFYDQFE